MQDLWICRIIYGIWKYSLDQLVLVETCGPEPMVKGIEKSHVKSCNVKDTLRKNDSSIRLVQLNRIGWGTLR